jgi:hypothetical protein
MSTMDHIDKVREQILNEAERLGPDDCFSFSCHPGVSCFNECCGDVNIALTPYDVLRLKRRLGLSSTDFLERYTIKPFTKEQKLPVVLLKMDETKPGKPCHLVTAEGCSVYDDRPWPCRMYPIGSASARTEQDPDAPEFFFVMQEEGCEGFAEAKSWTIRQWMDDQGVPEYNSWGEEFKEISLHPRLQQMELNPQQMEMFYTACYDLDRFRGFVFESSFLDKYEVEPEVVEAMRGGDEALLRFAFRWLRTCLFGEQTVKLSAAVAEQYKKRLEQQGMKPK